MPPSFFDALPLHIGCPALFLHFPSIPLPSVPRCGCSVFFSSFFFIFRILLSFSVFSSYFPHRLLLPSLFDALPLHIGCPALFLHFPSIPLPSIPRCGCFVLFSPVFFIYRALRSFLDFFSYFSRRLLLPSLFDALPLPSLYIGCHLVFFFIFLCSPPRLSGAFSSFSFYSPSFYFRLRLFRAFFILLFYFPYPALFFRLFSLFSAPVVAAFAFRCIAPSVVVYWLSPRFLLYFPLFPAAAVRRFFFIFLLFPFLLFPAAVVSCFFHPSFLFTAPYALFPPFHLIFRADCCCLRFSMHCPFISAVRRFFFIFPLFPFLLFPAAVVPCFFSSFFFIFRILRSFLDFFSYFPRRLFLCFFLVPGRR